jgi:ADP-ribose pyrophosphatase YjhB (NUDIX family)
MATVWRPPPKIRPLAIGLVRRNAELLLMAVRDDDGALKGWRPLGGGIEFGERAADALRREFVEELGLSILEPKLVTVIENLFDHHGAMGHEIVFAFEATFADVAAYDRERFVFRDGDVDLAAEWVPLHELSSAQLFPTGLLDHVTGPR